MNVLVVGSGGREHALAWKLQQSPRVEKLYIAPGNGGTARVGENVGIAAMEFQKLIDFAHSHDVGLTVVGPDGPLAAGIVDEFKRQGLKVFGPSKAAAQVESSKSFAKQFMTDGGIPTAVYKTFSSAAEAGQYVRTHGAPIVVKASGLALGKGVYVCTSVQEAEAAIDDIMIKKIFKDAGNEVVIEEYLEGVEFSAHAISDGADYVLFPSSQDHKRALDGDLGKNTGGMGTIAPVPWVDPGLMQRIEYDIVAKAFETFNRRGIEYSGVLYPGIMATLEGPKVLEFNARFGDPETQVYMRLLESDVLDLLEASAEGRLSGVKGSVRWRHAFAVNIVIASGGYPDAYQKGFPISGIDEAEAMEGVVVFHAGTGIDEQHRLITTGGRVLGVSAVGDSLKEALDKAYAACGKIHFDRMYYRKDIGRKSL